VKVFPFDQRQCFVDGRDSRRSQPSKISQCSIAR
jgi:hypothetical protein